MRRIFPFAVLFMVCFSPLVFAVDYGGLISGQLNADNSGTDTMLSGDQGSVYGKTIIAPWVSLPIGGVDFYLSAGIHGDFVDRFNVIPDLFRMEFSFKPVNQLSIRLGRFSWQDPSGFIAKGNFDGADALLDLGKIQLNAAALYTGFLYKDSFDINVSPTDQTDYNKTFEWIDFGNTYFAPRRFLTAMYGNFSGIPFERGNFQAGLMAQFDFSNAAEAFNTQYLVLHYTYIYKKFDFAASGAAELENTADDGFKSAYMFALEAGMQTGFLNLKDRLAAGLNWASGAGPYTAAFFPVIREAQGMVLKPWFSGMMTLWTQYKARIIQSLSADLTGRYFIRTDSASFSDPGLNDTGYLLGLELSSTLLWVPYSDLSFSLAAGIFLPQTGDAMNGSMRWSVAAGLIFSF